MRLAEGAATARTGCHDGAIRPELRFRIITADRSGGNVDEVLFPNGRELCESKQLRFVFLHDLHLAFLLLFCRNEGTPNAEVIMQ